MNVKTVVVGILDTNCYIIEKNNECLIIDPGDDFLSIVKNIDKEVCGVIITHYHEDHIGALDDILNKYKTKCYDRSNLTEGINTIEDFVFECLYTPGHTEDSITIYFKEENCMFVGDFIFKYSIGRTDLPGGSNYAMKNSIERILNYDDSITIYPGHYAKTSLKDERANLIFFKNRI